MIKAFPRPVVTEVDQDKVTLDRYSFWRVGPQAVPLYDQPNGSIVGEIARGFNYVNAINLNVEGWLQIQGGRWIKRDNAQYKEASFFKGVKLTDGLKYPFAWVLDKSTTYTSETPGGPASKASGRFLRRYERVNIFATAQDKDGWRWYMIGPNQWVKQTFVAKTVVTPPPQGVSGRWVAIDLYEQVLIAYEDTTPVFATLIASGLPKTETQEGLFKVWARLERDSMSGATGAPNAYSLQTVPWVMYFNGSTSLHGTYWHDLFGYRQSRGCVNMSISDAAWLFKWLNETKPDANGEKINYVYVFASGKYGGGVIRGS
jgi:hypothetical protein